MTVRWVLPVVRNSYALDWFVEYRDVCGWRWAFRGGGE